MRVSYWRILVLFLGTVAAGVAQTPVAQTPSGTSEADKLQFEREKFAYEKSQSTRNLIFTFLLTTIGGTYVTWLLGTRTWHRQTRIDLYRRRLEEGTQFLDAFSLSVGKRYFLMQRFLWALEGSDADRAQRFEKEYFKTVVQWNASYWVNRNKIRLLVNDAQANAFLDYQDDYRPDNPQSLHYLFVKAHRAVLKAKAGEVSRNEAQSTVDVLNWACSTYLENLTTAFVNKAMSLELLKTPSPHVSSLKAAIEQRPGLAIPPRLWSVGSADAADVPDSKAD
jgi:hypothetical protein